MMKKGFTTNIDGFTTASEAQHESQLSCLPSAGGAKACRAFTLIEAMVSISILMLAISGPLYTASRAIVAANNSRDQLTALYLAQEGIEYVRMMRDDAYMSRYLQNDQTASIDAWNDFLNGAGTASITNCRASSCTLDPMPSNIVANMGFGGSLAASSGNSPLYLSNDGTTNYYTQKSTGNTVQPFVRTIQVIDIPGTSDSPGAPYHEKSVVSIVSWSSHSIPYRQTVTDHITPWQ